MAKAWISAVILPLMALGLMGADAAPSHDFGVVPNFPAGSVLQISVKHDATRDLGGGQTIKLSSSSKFKLAPVAQDGGYRVKQYDMQVDAPASATPAEAGAIIAAAKASGEFSYDADTFLEPVAIADWDDYVAKQAQASAALSLVTGADPVTVDQLKRMTPEQAAAGLAEADFLALPQGMALDLNKPASGQNSAPGAVSTDFTYTLTDLDPAAGKATVTTRETLDPASAAAAANTIVSGKLAALGAAAPAVDRSQLTLQRTTACTYQMDLKTGLTLSADCTRDSRDIGDDLTPQVRSDHWVITQILTSGS